MQNLYFLRFANIFQTTNIDSGQIWNAVKTVKAETSIDLGCDKDGLYVTDSIHVVKDVENKLEIQSTEEIFENMTESELRAAAEMFIYLNTCPYTDESKFWFKSWLKFFTDVFATTPQEILITFNRLLNNENLQNKEVQIVKKLFERSSSLFSIRYDEYQNILPGNINKEDLIVPKIWNMQGINNMQTA